MESTKKKRKGGKTQDSRLSSKRRKAQNGRPGAPQSARRVVAVDALAWRQVDIPQTLEDAEGFFGLEEVEGVDVVRTDNQVQFVAAVSSSDAEEEFAGFGDDPQPSIQIDGLDGQPLEDSPRASGLNGKEQAESEDAEDISDDNHDEEIEPSLFSKLRDVEAIEEDETDVSAWLPLGLSQKLLKSISGLEFEQPTPIQLAAIPEVVKGRDVIGKAATGSGKTLAFAIPVVEKWLRTARGAKDKLKPLALVISPTRELAHQITKHFKDLCAGLAESPYICSVTGGLSVQKQQRQLEKADVVVGTPGRLWEVLSGSSTLLAAFRGLQFLILDEADRLLSEGHFKDAEEIFNALNKTETNEDGSPEAPEASATRQTLVFSATFNKALHQKLTSKGRFDLVDNQQSLEYLLRRISFRERPVFIDVNPVSQMATGLTEGLVECGAMEKDLYLYSILLLQPAKRVLVFTNSISAVRRITPMLQNLNLTVHPLQSQMPQKARLRSLERFATTQHPGGDRTSAHILVATDVAARGLDIPDVDLVIHYHVPRTADAYVHRSGRTARAEKSGSSILLCSPEEVVPTRRLVAKVHAAAQTRETESNASKKSKRSQATSFFIQTIDLDLKLVSRLRERVAIAKKISDAALAKEKGSADDNWMRQAAEELGTEYDSEELEAAGRWAGRGSGRKKREKEARSLTKADVAALRAELKALLSKRVNLGVSERYITSGKLNIEELLRGGKGEFLGNAGLGLDIVS